MKVVEIIPKTRHFKLVSEPGDSTYNSCPWALVTLDMERYSLCAETEEGHFSYCWKPTENESFLSLMCRIGEEYLLGKISDRCVFNFDESRSDTLRYFAGADMYSDIAAEVSTLNAYTEETFYFGCKRILSEYNIGDDGICIVKDFPRSAMAFASLFCSALQPVLRKLVAVKSVS